MKLRCNFYSLCLLVLACCLLAGCGAWFTVPNPTLGAKVDFSFPKRASFYSTSTEAMVEFEKQTNNGRDYKLGDGDAILVQVDGFPELTATHIIGPDGCITLPVAGPIVVHGLTREETAELITQTLQTYYLHVHTTVKVESYNSNYVTVVGRVENAGRIKFTSPPTLLEIIAQSGAMPVIQKEQVLTRCSIIRGNKILWVDLARLLTGDTNLNIRLQRDDVISIPDSTDTSFYVLGEVGKPGVYRQTPQMSLLVALAQAGGPTLAANLYNIRIIRPSKGVNLQVSLDDLLSPKPNTNVAILEGDVIYVPRHTPAKIGYIMQQVNPFTYFLMLKQFMPGL